MFCSGVACSGVTVGVVEIVEEIVTALCSVSKDFIVMMLVSRSIFRLKPPGRSKLFDTFCQYHGEYCAVIPW